MGHPAVPLYASIQWMNSRGLTPWLRQLGQRAEHDAWGEHFRKHHGVALAGSVEGVGGNAAAAEGGEGLGDGFVVTRPVGLHQDHVSSLKCVLDFRRPQRDTLVDLATQAPTGS